LKSFSVRIAVVAAVIAAICVWAVEMSTASEDPLSAPASSMSVFGGDGPSADTAMGRIQHAIDTWGDQAGPGALVAGKARALTGDSAPVHISAVPKSDGSVCVMSEYSVSEYSVGCLPAQVRASRLDASIVRLTPDSSIVVSGVLPDGATSVTVTTADGKSSQAELGENAYTWQAADASVVPVRAVARFEDGHTSSTNLPRSRAV